MMRPVRRPTPFGRTMQNVGWLLTGKSVGAVLSIVYLALATRSLGIAGFGQFVLILSIAQTIAAIVGFQTWQLVVKFGVAHSGAIRRSTALSRLIRLSLLIELAGAILGCLIAAVVIALMSRHFGWSPSLTRNAFAFCIVLLLSIRSTAVGVLRLHDRYAIGAAADAVTFVCRFLGAVVAVWLGPTVTAFLIAWAVAELFTAIAYWLMASREAPRFLRNWRDTAETIGENPGFWKFLFVSNLTSILTVVSRQFVVVLIGVLAGAAAAGGYRLAYQLSQALVRLADLFARGLFPEVARTAAAVSRDDLYRLMRQSSRLTLAVGLATCILVPILGKPLLLIIAGQSYLGVYPVLVLLGVAAGIDIIAVGYEPVLLGTGHVASAAVIRIVCAIVLFGGVTLLISREGIAGAGMAMLAASALALALLRFEVARLVRAKRVPPAELV